MGKGKKPTNALNKGASGRRTHGPKTHLHHDIWPKALRYTISQDKVLTKYDNYESWARAVSARGGKNISREEFYAFVNLSFEKKQAYFANFRKR